MPLFTLDPLLDSRWDDLVASHPRASAFHHRGWLKALAATYGYRPVVVTSSPPGAALSNGIVFCEIKSWITGSRLVSLPFSDHAEPLLDQNGDTSEFEEWMNTQCLKHRWKYIELRPLSWKPDASGTLAASRSFWFHALDLTPPLEQIFRRLHKDSLQRRIRKAEREQISCERGRSETLLNDFYRLLLMTRHRHELLPQPRAWFQNLIASMGSGLEIWLASKDGVAIAAILSLRHRNAVVYKYGCSNAKLHHLAGMPFLFWKLIEKSKIEGAEQIDFGRTDLDNGGLLAFKDRFGTSRSRLTYFRYPASAAEADKVASHLPAARHIFSVLPRALSSMAGRIAYRHVG